MAETETRAARNIAWIEKHCRVPEGRDVGKPLVLRPWQREFLFRIYDNHVATRTAIVSMPRKNAKTALVATLCLLHLAGPEARANSQLFSAAQSREQAAVLFGLAAKMVRMSPSLNAFVTVRDTAKQLHCQELGTLYRALSAEASTAHGLSPVFLVHDELGQVKGPRSPLYEALETATGAHDDPLSIIISTQAPTDADLLSTLIDDAATGADPRTVLILHSAPKDADPFAVATIRAANPACGDFLSEAELLREAEQARRLPSLEAAFRNLHLNQRVEAENPFVSRAVWQACAGPPMEDWSDAEVWGGLDLSATTDLTALVWVARRDGAWHVRPTFWLPADGLADRSRKDRVPYDLWHSQGWLETTPGAAIDWDFVAAKLWADFGEMKVRRVAFDRWGMRVLRPKLQSQGFAAEMFEGDTPLFADFGQGFASMSPALGVLERALVGGEVRHGAHPVLEMCAKNAVVTMDAAGNRKLDKARARGRIDGMVALAMAMAVAAEAQPAEIVPSVYTRRGLLVV